MNNQNTNPRPRRPLTEEEKRELARRRAMQAKKQDGPRAEGKRPPSQAKQTTPQRPAKKAKDGNSKKPQRLVKKRKEDTPLPRRRNEESYNFSRSLSETHERIMAERRERLEDARVFRKEDINQKLKFGLIAFCSVLALILIITTIAVSCSLSGVGVKKSKGEYEFTIGKNNSSAVYKDSAKNGMLYISMNHISELCGMTVGGSPSELRFTVPSGDWISFSPNSTQAKINGYGMEMPGQANMQDTKCSIPLDFLTLVLDGINVFIDEQNKKVTVTRIEYVDSTPQEPHYVEPIFMLIADIPLISLDENKYFANQPIFTFKNDLSSYESYMNPLGEKMNAYLMLVNKQYPLEDTSYDPNTVQYTNKDHGVYKDFWIEPNAGKALEAMMLEMKSAGLNDIFVTSAYRSYNRQNTLYNGYIEYEMNRFSSDAYAVLGKEYIDANYKSLGLGGLSYEDAVKVVKSYSAVPGESEHHTGLCVDLMSTSMSELDITFADNKAYDWLCANAWKFGFILRYPEGKENVTGYSYEPWHWRYVGRTHALEILRSGECLEEYLTRTGLSVE